MKTKFMTLMTVATLGIFSAATVMAAGNNDFYTQPPAGSEWEKADTEGTYASYTNGNDYVNIYKYSLEDVKTGIAKCNDTYDACYQTIYSEGNSLYMAVGYARDADDISDVRKFVEYISYPGNPSLTRQENENQTDDSSDDSDKATTDTASQKPGGDSDILTTSPMTLVDSDGNTIEINYILHKDYSCEYRGDDGMNYTDNGDETYTDENGNTYSALNDDTHHLGHTLEQHDLQDANGNTVTVTETTNGDYYFQDENGTGFTDNGDGTWSDENGNSYTETTSPMTLVDSDGNTIEINYILHKDYSCEYRGDDGMNYTDNGDETYTDENGNTYSALNDDTHHLGHTLEQHDLQDANGNTVTVTETTNGDYYFQDENGTGFTDNGDGTWSDENGNSYTEID